MALFLSSLHSTDISMMEQNTKRVSRALFCLMSENLACKLPSKIHKSGKKIMKKLMIARESGKAKANNKMA